MNIEQTKHVTSKYVHIVISTLELQDYVPLLNYLKQKANNYVISHELGETSHDHLECFAELLKEQRIDHIKRSILKLYPLIPKNELKNVRVTKNIIDSNPLYGYGYALKENNVKFSTLDSFQVADAIEYYEKHRDHVNDVKSKFLSKNKSKIMSLDEYGSGLLGFLTLYFHDHNYEPGININWLIKSYRQTLVKNQTLKLSTYMKINNEKLSEFCDDYLGAILLTPPSINPSISYEHLYQTVHPLLPLNET